MLMKIDVVNLIKDLQLIPFGTKGWMTGHDLKCSNCNKSGKFGIRIENNRGAAHCFKCEFSESIYKYLKRVDKLHLIDGEIKVSISKVIENPFEEKVDFEEIELSEITLPKGFTRIDYDEYLCYRGFSQKQYEKFGVGKTDHFIEKRLHNYLIFQIKQDNKLVAWLARSKNPKEWHEENLKKFKNKEEQLVLRYRNSQNVDFIKILGNIDDITDETHTVILVEGLFDAENVINKLNLNQTNEVKCCFTFGNKVSEYQLELLKRKKSVKNIILMYDFNTIGQVKKFGMELSKHFNIDIAEINDKNIDPGDASKEYLLFLIKNRKSLIDFYTSRIPLTLNHGYKK